MLSPQPQSHETARANSHRWHWRTRFLLAALAVVAVVTVAAWRASSTAEGLALCGSIHQRADLCRTLPKLPAWRRDWILRRFLAAAAADVRGAAITAWERSADLHSLQPRIEGILENAGEVPALRTKAGLALLGRTPPAPAALAFIGAESAKPDFRRDCSRLVAAWWDHRLPQLADAEALALLRASMDDTDPAREPLRELVRQRVARFAAFREEFLARLEKPQSAGLREFLTACLAALSGGMRGQSAADWRQSEVSEAAAGEFHAVEAEWVTEVKPNYQVDEKHGAFGLMLGEGAGGFLQWLKGYDGTVDIGSARLSFFAPVDGTYTLWARVWLGDKCGNSFGLWLDDENYGNFPDATNELAHWHWLALEPAAVALKAGFHKARLEAWEDNVFIDTFALLPPGRNPESLPAKAAVRWDPELLPSLSFTPEFQAQARGTTQRVVVWVRRHSPKLQEGTLEIEVPPPFRLQGTKQVTLRFEKGNPLVRTSFFLELPADAVGYEGMLRAVYRDKTGATIQGELPLTAQFDWLTTGPLPAADPLQVRLAQNPAAPPAKADAALWRPYPAAGLDAYRRLDPERAFGQLEDCYFYVQTEIEVAADGTYLGLLTADDWARIWLDGQLVIEQADGGPGEGRLIQTSIPIRAGHHRLAAQFYQAAFADPDGPDAGRHSFNNCNFKFLLRKGIHEPASEIRGLPRRALP